MVEATRPEINLKEQDLGPSTTRLHDGDSGWTRYAYEVMLSSIIFPDPTFEPQACFDGDPLQNGTIFISTEVKVKSTGKLKFMTFFHIKKKEEVGRS